MNYRQFMLFVSVFLVIAANSGVDASNLYLSHVRENISDAKEHCLSVNGKLISILSGNQDTDLRVFLGVNDGTTILTSGFRNDDKWYWTVTNVSIPMTYQNWRPNQPFGANDCLAIRGLGLNYGWHSVPCNHKLPFVCNLDL